MLIFDRAHTFRFPSVLRVEGDPPAADAGGGGGENKPAAPSFVPAEEFKQFQATMTGFMETMKSSMEGFAAIASRPAGAPAAPTTPEITAEQYADAIADPSMEGSRKVIAQYEREREARMARRLDERVGQVESTGLPALEQMAINQMKMATDEKGKPKFPHFTRFEKEIRARGATLHPGHRAQPIAWEQLYKVVVGENFATLVDEETERVLRKRDDPAPGAPNAQSSGRERTNAQGGTPTVRDLGGEDAERALVAAGKDGDSMARRMGYKDFADYMEKCKDYIAR